MAADVERSKARPLRLRPYVIAARKGFARNVQYRWAHMINNVASAVFGFVFIAVWQAASGPRGSLGPYTPALMTHYIAFGQVALWVTHFFNYGLGIPESVRTGGVALHLMRPVSFFGQVLAREAGQVVYHALYRSSVLVAIFAVTTGFYVPHAPVQYLATLVGLAIGAYVGLCMTYLVGLSAFWTTEVRWTHYIYQTLSMTFEGNWIPVDLLPGISGQVAPYLPFAAQVYYPARLYLGLGGPAALLVPAAWALVLTGATLWATSRARRKVEVQGG